eukprot:8233436-Pyramimonas_sp.AAC.1
MSSFFAICVNCKSYKGKVAFKSCRTNREHIAGDWNRVAFPIGAKVFFKDLPYTVHGYHEATILISDDDGAIQPVSLHNARRLVVVQLPSLAQGGQPAPLLHDSSEACKAMGLAMMPIVPTGNDPILTPLHFLQNVLSALPSVDTVRGMLSSVATADKSQGYIFERRGPIGKVSHTIVTET